VIDNKIDISCADHDVRIEEPTITETFVETLKVFGLIPLGKNE
jgi:hypothetical protein